MEIETISIYVWHGKAYLPVLGQFKSGIFAVIEPVYIANLNSEELVSAIQKVRLAGHPLLPETTREEWQRRQDPILSATEAGSWMELARSGASYGVSWTNHEVRLDMSRLDKKGRWENDPIKVRIFPPDKPLQFIVEVILEDIESRPELMKQSN